MTIATQRLCIWAGVAMFPFFFVGFWVVAGFIPPPSPALDATTIAAMFADHRTAIRLGLMITGFASALLALFFGALSSQIRRIERNTSALAYAQAIAGACSVLEFIFPLFAWQTAAFRVGRPASEVQMLNDLAWLPFMGITSTFIVQVLIIAVVVFRDDRRLPVWPRWIGYLNVWVAVGIAPGSFVVFFQQGPLAWNGALAFYLVVASFFVWMVAMTWAMLRALRSRQAAEGATHEAVELDPTSTAVSDVAQA